MTTPGTTETLATDVGETAADAELTAGLDAVARLFDDAMDRIARLADTSDAPDEVRVLRLVERPEVLQRVEAAAA